MSTVLREAAAAPVEERARRVPATAALATLAGALLVATLHAIGTGAAAIAPADVVRGLLPGAAGTDGLDAQTLAIVREIRLPRVLLALVAGAALGTAGALMQGLFRNPLADPALVGVAAGGALAAGLVIVLGGGALTGVAGALALPLAAFAGALTVTALVYRVGHADGVLSLPAMLLAGIALNAAAFAGLGFLMAIANDQQLRDLTFWNLGSLGGASAPVIAAVAPLVLPCVLVAWRLAPALNVLALGEARAAQLGVDVRRTKGLAIVATALATGATVAVTGVVGFVGLVAPHLVRLACGPDQRVVVPGAALAGALLVVLADTVARTAAAPADLPLGVLTATLGAPLFVALLLRQRRRLGAEAA